MLGKLDFKELSEIEEKVVLIDVCVCENGNIEIGIGTSKATKQGSEFGDTELQFLLSDFVGGLELMQETFNDFILSVDSLLCLG